MVAVPDIGFVDDLGGVYRLHLERVAPGRWIAALPIQGRHVPVAGEEVLRSAQLVHRGYREPARLGEEV